MTDQIASLVVEVDASGAKKAAVDLDSLTKAADRADAAANDLEGSTRKLSAAEKTVADEAKRAMGAFNGLAGEQEAAVRTAQRLNAAHGSAVISSKALNQATLNLGRQFTDLGVQIGGGANPLIALMQQLPQITDGLAMAKAQGISAGQAFQALFASVVPIAAPILAIGAAAGAAFGLFERAIDQNTKHATSWGDTWRATVKVVGDYIMDGPIGDGLKWLGGAFSKTLDFIIDGVTGWYDRTVGLFIAAYKTITTHWKDLPAAFGAIMIGAANGVISGIQFIVDGAMGAINYFRKKAGMDEFARVELPKLTQANNAAARDFEKYWTEATASVRKSREGFADDVARQADKEFEKRQKAKKATEDHTKAIKANAVEIVGLGDDALQFAKALEEVNAKAGLSAEAIKRLEIQTAAAVAPTQDLRDRILAAGRAWEERNRVAKESAEILARVKTAANDNIRTFDALGVTIPTAMENAAFEMDEAASRARNLRFDIEDIARAIENHDWASGFAGLLNVLAKVEIALGKNATQLEKVQALAGIGMGVGSIVGGTAGAGISGAASGALGGAAFAGSKLGTLIAPGLGTIGGALIGGAVGLVGSLFGSSKAKKQQRAQEAAQRAAEEAARQQQISDTTFSLNVALLEAQGKAEEALAMTRQRELDALAKLDPSLVALQQQLYDLEDVANATAKAAEEQARWAAEAAKAQADQQKIALDLMALDDAVTGGNSAVLAARQIELAALDATSQELKRIYYARLDEGEALAKQAAAQEAAAEAARAYQDANIGLMRQLMALDDAANGGTSARDAGRADELAKLDATGKALQAIIWARQDEAEAMAKQAAAAETLAAQQAEVARVAAEFQATNIGLMRQLMAMDDAVLGTTSARDAMRADELAKLDATGKYLQQIIWARQDEADRIAKQTEAMEAAAARAKELASRQGSIQDQIDQLTLSSSDLLLKTRSKERAEAMAFDASLGPLLDSLYALQDAAKAAASANEAAASANEAAAEGQRVAAEAAQRAADIQAERQSRLASLLEAQGRNAEATLLRRSIELASITDPVQRALQQQVYVAQDAADRVSKAQAALTKAYDTASGAAEDARAKFADLGKTLREYSGSLSSSIPATLNPLQQRAVSFAAFQDAATRARLGDTAAMADLPALGDAFKAASQAAAKDQISYLRDLAFIKDATDAAAEVAGRQETIAEQQLKALNNQVAGLLNVEEATVSVEEAVAEMRAALSSQQSQQYAGQISAMNEQLAALWDLDKLLISVEGSVRETGMTTTQALVENGVRQLQAIANLATIMTSVNTSVLAVNTSTMGVQSAIAALAKVSTAVASTPVTATPAVASTPVTATPAANLSPAQAAANPEAAQAWALVNSNVGLALKQAGDPLYDQMLAKAKLYGSNLPGFATGGSFEVGGVGGADSQIVPLRLTPGEMVNVSREDNMRAMADAIAALTRENAAMRQEISGLRSDMSRTARASEKTANILTRVSRDGDSLITQAA